MDGVLNVAFGVIEQNLDYKKCIHIIHKARSTYFLRLSYHQKNRKLA